MGALMIFFKTGLVQPMFCSCFEINYLVSLRIDLRETIRSNLFFIFYFFICYNTTSHNLIVFKSVVLREGRWEFPKMPSWVWLWDRTQVLSHQRRVRYQCATPHPLYSIYLWPLRKKTWKYLLIYFCLLFNNTWNYWDHIAL
jgi:hypothetical protein